MPTIAPYRDDDGEEPRPCERAALTSGTKCVAAIILRDENDKHRFLRRAHAAQHLRGNQDLLARVVIELALTVGVSKNAWGCWLRVEPTKHKEVLIFRPANFLLAFSRTC
jgi:hypothetical protein